MRKIIKQNVGVEVDSTNLKVCFKSMYEGQDIKVKGSRTFTNNTKGFKEMEIWLEKKRQKDLCLHLTMEATGVYGENAAYHFEPLASYEVHVVLPNMSSAFFKSHNIKSKTDKIDAAALGLLGLERKLDAWQPASTQMRHIKKLSRERIRLQRSKTMIKNQLHAESKSYCPEEQIISRCKELVTFIESQIKFIEADLEQVLHKDKVLKAKVEKVCTIKGVGRITATGVIAEFNGFTNFNNRNQVMSFAGYDVVQHESGNSVKGKTRMSKKGNSYVRHLLYMGSMSAARFDPHHKALYDRIVSRTGIKMKANVAVQRKLLLLIYALYTKNQVYDPLHHQQVTQRLKPKNEKLDIASKLEKAIA